jgi:hypothetical protein
MRHCRYTAERFVTLLQAMPAEVRARVDERVRRDLDPRYVEHGEPCCLVAYLLLEAGVEQRTLRDLDREMTAGAGTVELRHSRHPFWSRFEPSARQLLEFLQIIQDYGRTWGEVADEALTPEPARGLFGVRWGSRYPSGRPWLAVAADSDVIWTGSR